VRCIKITKCGACGYVYDVNYTGPDYREVYNGDEPFREINGSFTVKSKYSDYGDSIEEISLYICPKCFNVIADL
jgi:rubredoxin